MHEAHGSELSGHFGLSKVYRKLKRRYWWRDMRGQIKSHIHGCLIYAARQGNHPRQLPPLQNIPIPERPWSLISMDLVELNVTAEGNKYVLVVIDHFSKFMQAVPLPNKRSQTVSDAIKDRVFQPFGTPDRVLTDRGMEFRGFPVQDLFKTFRVEHQ